MYKRRYLLILVLILVLSGCAPETPAAAPDPTGATQPGNSQESTTSELQTSSGYSGDNKGIVEKDRLIVLSSAGEGQGDVSTLIPLVVDGINTANQQGSSTAAQNLIADGALRVGHNNQLNLLVFLKPSSLVKFSETPPYVKGSRDAGFLWSCVQSKLQKGIDKMALTSGKKESLEQSVQGFRLIFFNTEGHELSISMPGNIPIVQLDGIEVTESPEMHDRARQFFAATF